jgi:hypothetical protein
MISKVINHKEKAESRLATEYRDSVRLIGYIRSLLYDANNLEQVFKDIVDNRWIETASGVNLDILGSIVGQSREFIDAEIFDYFGFFDNPIAQSFGTVDDPGIGGRFRIIGEPTQGLRQLSDDEYRLFIKARIIKNTTSSTPEEIISLLGFLFDTDLILFIDGNTSYDISIGRRLSLNDKSIISQTDIVPKTAGVSASYITEFDSNDFFSFKTIPGSLGFGSVNNSELGGQFGQLIF